MNRFEETANSMVIYKLKTSWLQIFKLYNEIARDHDATIGMAFTLIALDEEEGTPVTSIAPRIGMEPNSLSRILKTMDDREMIYRKRDAVDQRKTYICLTEYGQHMREIALKAVFHLEKAITERLDPDHLKGFFEVVNQIPEAINDFREKREEVKQA